MDEVENQAYKEANKILQKAEGFKLKAKYKKRLHEEYKCYKFIKKTLKQDVPLMTESLYRLGDGFMDVKDYEKAMGCYIKTLELFRKVSSTKETLKAVYLKLIDCLGMVEDGDNMIYFAEKAIKEDLLTLDEKINLYNQLAVYLDRKFYKTDIENYLLKILDLEQKKQPKEPLDHCDALLGLGAFYYEEKNFELSIQYLEQAVCMYHSLDEPRDYMFECYLILAHIYKKRHHQVKFFTYFQLANKIDTQLTKLILEDDEIL